jgi:flagellar basal-body rod protein FlgC
MNELDVLSSAAAGMDAQRAALDLAARNVAAAQAAPDGRGFGRLVPRFATAAPPTPDVDDADLPAFEAPAGEVDEDPGLPVRYLGARVERGADLDAVTEMVAILDAQRAYEMNASVFEAGKRLAERTIDVGRL